MRLKENYRSTPEIVGAAKAVIAHNGGERELEAVGPSGAAVRLVRCASELSEGIFVAKEIARMAGGLDMLGKGREEKLFTFDDIAVVVRTHRQAEAIERCLRHDDIPCSVTGKTDFSGTRVGNERAALAFFSLL